MTTQSTNQPLGIWNARNLLTVLEVAERARVHPICDSSRVQRVPESQKAQFQEPADKLAHHLMPPKDLVFLTHYFASRWLLKCLAQAHEP